MNKSYETNRNVLLCVIYFYVSIWPKQLQHNFKIPNTRLEKSFKCRCFQSVKR